MTRLTFTSEEEEQHSNLVQEPLLSPCPQSQQSSFLPAVRWGSDTLRGLVKSLNDALLNATLQKHKVLLALSLT